MHPPAHLSLAQRDVLRDVWHNGRRLQQAGRQILVAYRAVCSVTGVAEIPARRQTVPPPNTTCLALPAASAGLTHEQQHIGQAPRGIGACQGERGSTSASAVFGDIRLAHLLGGGCLIIIQGDVEHAEDLDHIQLWIGGLHTCPGLAVMILVHYDSTTRSSRAGQTGSGVDMRAAAAAPETAPY